MPNDEPERRASPYGPRDPGADTTDAERSTAPEEQPAEPQEQPAPASSRASLPVRAVLIPVLIGLLVVAFATTWEPPSTVETAEPSATPTRTIPPLPDTVAAPLTGDAPPSFGRLVVGYDDHKAFICAGAVVGQNADRVVTSAWCLDRPDSDAAIERIEFAAPFNVASGPIRLFPGDMATVFVHPQYDSGTFDHDLAVVRIGPDDEGDSVPVEAAAEIAVDVETQVDAIAFTTIDATAETPEELIIEEKTVAGCVSTAVFGTLDHPSDFVLACPEGVYSSGGPVYERPTDGTTPATVVALMSYSRSVDHGDAPSGGRHVVATPIDQVIVDEVMRP